MAGKSDFAQKLLHDLRVRKEKMGATQNSRTHPNQTSGGTRGDPVQTHRGARRINGHAGSRIGNSSRRSGGGNKAISTTESSNQIVLYNGGNNSKQVKDLSMAIAFAFENGGKLKKIGTSSSNPLVNFFNRFSRGTTQSGKMDMIGFNKNSYSTYQVPTVSHIHVAEIAKGVQYLNQILQACSNGLDFDRNSIEVGKELLRGAISLEESLRMLVNLQEGSRYTNGNQQKSRIRLLEEGDDDQDNSDKTANQRQLDRPKFSFDKPTTDFSSAQRATKNDIHRHLLAPSYLDEATTQPVRDSKMVPHKRSASCVPDFDSHSTHVKLRTHPSAPHSTQEKGRISNVIAKLMGLEELPQKDNPTRMSTKPEEGNQKDRKASNQNTKLPGLFNGEGKDDAVLSTDKTSMLTNNLPQIMDIKFNLKAERSREIPDRNSKIKNSETNQPRKTSKVLTVGTDATAVAKVGTTGMNKQQNQTILPNKITGSQTSQGKEQNQTFLEKEERKTSEIRESYVLQSNHKPHQRAKQNDIFLKDENVTRENIEFKARSNYVEKMEAKKDRSSNQPNPQDRAFQIANPENPEIPEAKYQEVQNGHPFLKQNLTVKKHKGHQEESIILSNSNQSPANTNKKHSVYKATPGNGISMRHAEKVTLKDRPNNRCQDDPPTIKTPHYTEGSQEVIVNEDQNHKISLSEPTSDEAQASTSTTIRTQEKPIAVSATAKKSNSKKHQKNKNPRKIEVVMAIPNGNINQLPRSLKESANVLQDLKQRMQDKRSSAKRMEQQSGNLVKQGEVGIITHGSSKMKTEPSNQSSRLFKEAEHTTESSHCGGEDHQKRNMQNTSTPSDTSDDFASKSVKVLGVIETVEELRTSNDEREIKQYDQSIGDHEERDVVKDFSQLVYKQFSESGGRQEQLTEDEKDLKEILIKSQLFLNAAEALFKLNIPFTFLHPGDPNDQVSNKRLILDCGYEVMNRKARRYQVTHHPCTNTTINCSVVRSLDDLVKQLSKDLEILRFYGGDQGRESDVAGYLYNMLNKDIHNDEPDVNSTWDFEWNKMTYMFPEKEGVIKDVEKQVLNGLLDEISNDLLVTVQV